MRKYFVYLVPIATLATLLVNLLSGMGKINDTTPQALSDSYPVLFVPAGYVFAIWGVIYVGMILYTIYQFRHRDEEDLNSTRELYVVASLANISWIFLWHYRHPLWSVLAMVILLISLITIYLKLGIGVKKVNRARSWMVQTPFSIYLGWISVATIANITVALYVLKWSGFGISSESWSAIMIMVAMVLALLMLIKKKDTGYAIVIIWAVLGINIKFQDIGIIYLSSLFCVAILSGSFVYTALRKYENYIKLEP